MFAVIVTIGSCGILAIMHGQDSDELVAQSFERANHAGEMRVALDREDVELLEQLRPRDSRHRTSPSNARDRLIPSPGALAAARGARRLPERARQGTESDGLVRSTEMFDAANRAVAHDGWADSEPLLKTLAARQASFVTDSRVVAGALAAGDYARAIRIDTHDVRPNVAAMRHALDTIAVDLYRASLADAAEDHRVTWDLQRLIAVVTGLGVLLMGGFAVLLGRYK